MASVFSTHTRWYPIYEVVAVDIPRIVFFPARPCTVLPANAIRRRLFLSKGFHPEFPGKAEICSPRSQGNVFPLLRWRNKTGIRRVSQRRLGQGIPATGQF